MMLHIVGLIGYMGFMIFLMWLISVISIKILGVALDEEILKEGDVVSNKANPNVKVQITDIQAGTPYFTGVFIKDVGDVSKLLEYEFEKSRFRIWKKD